MPSTPAYDRVRRLCGDLKGTSKITERRRAAEELLTALADPFLLAGLRAECGGDAGGRMARAVWGVAVGSALTAAKRSIEKPAPRIGPDDVTLPLAVLRRADADTAQLHPGPFGRGAAGGGAGPGAGTSGSAAGDGDGDEADLLLRLDDAGHRTKLGPDLIQQLVEYCLHVLAESEKCREHLGQAELDRQMLPLLNLLCSRPDYVCHFHPERHVQAILAEVERRVGSESRDREALDAANGAARIFSSLVHQLSVRLGMGMHALLGPGVQLVAEWCRRASERDRPLDHAFPYLYSSATALLSSHPDHAVAALRRHGRHLLALAKRMYLQSQGIHRDALVEYLLVHLRVCEEAGRIQGLMPGDLGDCGRASLTREQVDSLLSLVLSEKDAGKAFPSQGSAATATAPSSRKRRRSGGAGGRGIRGRGSEGRAGAVWAPTSQRQRRILELGARLLSSAQRYWIATEEILSTDNPTEMLLQAEEDGGEERVRRAVEERLLATMVESPFASRIACRICTDRALACSENPIVSQALAATQQERDSGGGVAERERPSNSLGSAASPISTVAVLPLIDAIAASRKSGQSAFISDPTYAVASLRIICACADAFPRGECWSVSHKWLELEVRGIIGKEKAWRRGSSPKEVASVVFVVASLLVEYGGSTGNHDVQLWSLLCLLKLAQASILAVDGHSLGGTRDVLVLNQVWMHVWETLFRSDLRYSSYTSSSYEGSTGELVLMLMTDIVSLRLTDPVLNNICVPKLPHHKGRGSEASPISSLSANQAQVWNLPVFHDAHAVQSRAIFELTTELIRKVGLLEHGSDVIDCSLDTDGAEMPGNEDDTPDLSQAIHANQLAGRRFRLFVFCLRFAEQATRLNASDAQRHALPLACECLTVLLGRNHTPFPTLFSLRTPMTYRVVEDEEVEESFKSFLSLDPLNALWQDYMLPMKIQDIVEDDGDYIQRMLYGRGVRLFDQRSRSNESCAKTRIRDLHEHGVNSVSPSICKILQSVGIDRFQRLLSLRDIRTDDAMESGCDEYEKVSVETLSSRTQFSRLMLAKVIISLALAGETSASCADTLIRIASDLGPVIDKVTQELKNQSKDSTSILVQQVGIFRALMALTSTGCISISKAYGAAAKNFYDACKDSLQSYSGSSTVTSPQIPSGQVRVQVGRSTVSGRETFDSESDDNEDRSLMQGVSKSELVAKASVDSDDDFLSRTKPLGKKRHKRSTSCGALLPKPLALEEGTVKSVSVREAWMCAIAIATLEPSLESCKIVSASLVKPDGGDIEGNSGPDLVGVLLCLRLFSNTESCLRGGIMEASIGEEGSSINDNEETIPVLCTQMILRIRSCAQLPSLLYMYGFQAASRLLSLVTSMENTSNAVVDSLVELIHPEASQNSNRLAIKHVKRALKRRSRIKLRQIRAVVTGFFEGSDYFHTKFDSAYARSFVLPCLLHIDGQVREVAVWGVGAALTKFSNQRPIVTNVSECLSPLPLTDDETKSRRKFEKWIKAMHNHLNDGDRYKDEVCMWYDAAEALEHTSIQCHGVIARYTIDEAIMEEFTFSLIRLSSARPKVMSMCFYACDLVAFEQGFHLLEKFFNDEKECFLQGVIEDEIELSYIPLLLTSPNLVRALMRIYPAQPSSQRMPDITGPARCGDRTKRSCSLSSKLLSIDMDKVEEEASSMYVLKSASTLIPLIMLQSKTLGKTLEAKEGQGWSESGWRYLSDASVMLTGGCTDSDLAKILKTHLHDILAFVFPILKEGELVQDEEKSSLFLDRAHDAISSLTAVVSEEIVTRQGPRVSFLVVRQILRLSGRGIKFLNHRLQDNSFVSAIEYLTESIGAPAGKGSLFENAGSSTTELMIEAKGWLDEAVNSSQQGRAWSVIEVICNQVLREMRRDTHAQLSFVVHVLLCIVLDRRYFGICMPALELLFNIFSECFSAVSADCCASEIGPHINEVVLSFMQLHEKCQKEMITKCLECWLNAKLRGRRSVGLLHSQSADSEDMWGWDKDKSLSESLLSPGSDNVKLALRAYSKVQPGAGVMSKCYDILEMLLLKSPKNLANAKKSMDPFPVSSLAQTELNALSEENYKYSLEALILRFEGQRGSKADNYEVESELRSFIALIERGRSLSGEANVLNVQVRSQISGLIRLENVIRVYFKGKDASQIPCGSALYKSIHLLFDLISENVPNELKLVASRCIGELSSFDLSSLRAREAVSLQSIEEDRLATNELSDANKPLLQIESNAIELLARFLKSSDSSTAIVAKDTIKAVLRTRDGVKCWRRMKEGKLKRQLGPLGASNKKISRGRIPTPTKHFLNALASKCGISRKGIGTDRTWCWGKEVWKCIEGETVSYDIWLSDLVCSLILCCYNRDGNNLSTSNGASASQPKGTNEIFACCAAMCAAEAEFAEKLFPGIILDLLLSDSNEKDCKSKDSVQFDIAIGSAFSEANRLLTSSFLFLIRPTSSESSAGKVPSCDTMQRALCLAVDTLDFLRRLVQSRFMKSLRHRRNTNIMPKPVGDVSENHTKRKTSSSFDGGTKTSLKYVYGLQPNQLWRGVPFGVVLHLSGLDVASACLRARRYASALFYAEMVADNYLGGSGGFFERTRENKVGGLDISGYGSFIESFSKNEFSPMEVDSDLSVVLALSSLVKMSLSNLQETDALEGIEVQDSAVRFHRDAASSSIGSSYIFETSSSSDWRRLVGLDTRLQICTPSEVSSRSFEMTRRLKRVGLRHVLNVYMKALHIEENSKISQTGPSLNDQERLKEVWFEESWKAFQWDDSLMDFGPNAGGPKVTATQSQHLVQSPSVIRDTLNYGRGTGSIGSSNRQGLNESIYHLLYSALEENDKNFESHIISARIALMNEMSKSVGKESLLGALPEFSLRMKALNELDDLKCKYFDPSEPSSEVLDILGQANFSHSTDIESAISAFSCKSDVVKSLPTVDFESKEFAMSIKELALRLLLRKCNSEKCAPFFCALVSHLNEFCSTARQYGRPEVADTCLSRLGRVFDAYGSCIHSEGSKLNASLRLYLEDAKLKDAKGDFSAAIRTCKLVLGRLTATGTNLDSKCIISDAAALCGQLTVESKIETGQSILEQYLKPAKVSAIEIYKKNQTKYSAIRVCQTSFSLAQFVASLYNDVKETMEGADWAQAGKQIKDKRIDLKLTYDTYEKTKKELDRQGKAAKKSQSKTSEEEIQKVANELRELRIHKMTLEKELQIDMAERRAVEKSQDEYLLLAIKSFGSALSIYDPSNYSGDVSKHIFRMISLWFGNPSSSVNNLMQKYLSSIPTYLFMQLTYQIFARIDQASSNGSDFEGTLRNLVVRMCTDHPYHTLVPLITLTKGSQKSKAQASMSILKTISNLSGKSKYVADLADSYGALTDSYRDLALYDTLKYHSDKDGKSKPKSIPLSATVNGGRGRGSPSLDRVLGPGRRKRSNCAPCILTKVPMLRPGGDYGDGKQDPVGSERIDSFDPTFNITDTGLHRPKIIICRGTQGGHFRQLVKGDDDIRQDAIMQQVFSTVNNLLKRRNPASKVSSMERAERIRRDFSRRLSLVTYNIIPLSPDTGVLEWVNDTVPFGDFLTDKGRGREGGVEDGVGAHSRYYPGEWSSRLCHSYLREAELGAKGKRQAFDAICERFSPAFRFFFVERFSHSLQAWHVARTMYTRSCAVSSIVGHILGIGDRHAHNILVHQKTGELVHIDFGIVFEQGRCLTTPEKVPFRLTRDIIDGMGPSGTEGNFSLAAQATAAVLRDNAETLLTIVSAVISDPLYKWSVDPLKKRRVQHEGEGEVIDDGGDRGVGRGGDPGFGRKHHAGVDPNQNEAANRAVQKVQQKLQGYEEGTSGERQSVEGQVQLLINSARDPDNLAVMYPGWMPWL